MAHENSFALLVDDEGDDMAALIAAVAAKAPALPEKKTQQQQQPQKGQQPPSATAKLPSKPLPPAESGIYYSDFFFIVFAWVFSELGFVCVWSRCPMIELFYVLNFFFPFCNLL